MPTLSLLHRRLILNNAEEDVLLPAIRSETDWELVTTSTLQGASSPYYRSPMMLVLPAYWTQNEIRDFMTVWPIFQLSSIELTDSDYDEIIALLKDRSVLKTSPVD